MADKRFKCFPSNLHSSQHDMFATIFTAHEVSVAKELLFGGPLDNVRPTQKDFIIKYVIPDLSAPSPIYDASEPIYDPYVYYRYKIGTARSPPTTLEKIINLHHGQRKLQLTDLQAVMETIKILGKEKNITVVYAGAAPGCHIVQLLELFSNVTYHLYDPADFDPALKSDSRVHIHQGLFTDEIADSWRDKCNTFICDIRVPTADYSENEKQIASDMQAQATWALKINADLSSLKFRPPYVNNQQDADAVKDYKYLAGVIYWGIFPPVQSTEGRLFLTKADLEKKYQPFDPIHYQDACAQHNIRRVWKNNKSKLGANKIPGYDRCVDCTLEYALWSEYIELMGGEKTIDQYMNWLSSICRQPLNYVIKRNDDRTSALPGIKLHGIGRSLARAERIKILLPYWEKYISEENSDQEKRRADNIEKGMHVFKEKYSSRM